MTQPAWPSNMWQILSSDYDTQASFYGVKKACEPLHVQLDLSDYSVAVVNTTTTAQPGMTVTATVYSLDNKQLLQHSETEGRSGERRDGGVQAGSGAGDGNERGAGEAGAARTPRGKWLSDNLYWLAAASAIYRQLNHLPAATCGGDSDCEWRAAARSGCTLQNTGTAAALANKLTLVNASDGSRILPAYYSDNYVSLLPGRVAKVEIEYPASAAKGEPQVNLRGWSLAPTSVAVQIGDSRTG